jgi:hypothetical protein
VTLTTLIAHGIFDFKGTIKSSCKHVALYEDFLETLNDYNLTKIISGKTRDQNVLDLFLTSSHTHISKSSVIPGISDHDIVSVTADLKPNIVKQKPRNVPLYRKANWQDFKAYMESFKK